MSVASEARTSKNLQFHTEFPAPAWCRNVLRLAADLEGAAVAVVGLKEEDRWITFAVGAESFSTEDLVGACEHVVRAERSRPSKDEVGANPILERSIVGVRLWDPEGRTVGALFVLPEPGASIDSAIERVLAELATLIAPLAVSSRSRNVSPEEFRVSADPVFLVRVLGKIQPLVSEIVAFSEVLQREVIGTSRKRAELIHQNGTCVVRTLKSVLDLIDLETRSAEANFVATDLARVARDELEAHRPQVRKRALRLNFRGAEERIFATTDESALRRILRIMLSNAVGYTSEGGISVEVTRTSTHGQIAVRDTGRGISPDFIPKLFQPFAVEGGGERSKPQGSGMGLALAKSLADRAGLELLVESRPGEGSTFTVRCRLTDAVKEESTNAIDAETDVRLDIAHRPLVLLVEDNAVARRVIEMMVREDYDLVAASTVDEALERAREYQFDLLLLDVSLNERRTGVEVLHGVRRMVRYQTVPAVACTANTRPGLRERFLDAGFDGYMAKPFRANQLLETMAAALEQGRRKASLDVFEGEVDIDLPPLPATLPRLLELVSNEDGPGDPNEVRQILEADPAASSCVLSHVNSAYFSVRGQVATVERAVTLVGAETISNLVISGLLSKTFESFASDVVRRVHARIVNVSLGTAGFAKILAKHLHIKNPELAFTAGLLHDTGRLCMLAHDPEPYAALWLQEDEAMRPPEIGQELLHFDVDHVRVGAHVSKEWELPAELGAVVSMFEDPDRALPRHRSLVSVVAAARAAVISLISEDAGAPGLGNALRRLETLHDVAPGDLGSLIEDRKDEVRSLLESMRANA